MATVSRVATEAKAVTDSSPSPPLALPPPPARLEATRDSRLTVSRLSLASVPLAVPPDLPVATPEDSRLAEHLPAATTPRTTRPSVCSRGSQLDCPPSIWYLPFLTDKSTMVFYIKIRASPSSDSTLFPLLSRLRIRHSMSSSTTGKQVFCRWFLFRHAPL